MFKNYLKITLAVLMRRKFFTFISLFGITFTLMVLMVATAFLDHLFGGFPPEVNQDRTLGIYRAAMFLEKDGKRSQTQSMFAGYYLLDKILKDMPHVEETAVASLQWQIMTYTRGQRVKSYIKYVNPGFWKVLQFEFLEGRPITLDEYVNASLVAVINESTRDKFFPGETASGKYIEVDQRQIRVVGVVKDVSFLRLFPFADIWSPITIQNSYMIPNEYCGNYFAQLLVDDKVNFGQVRDEFASRIASLDLSMHAPLNRLIVVPETMFQNVARLVFALGNDTKDYSSQLLGLLLLFAVLFMILPAINLVNLNISRIMERSSEIGIRKSFGASSKVLIGQFITENVLLTVMGGLFSLVLSYAALAIVSNANLLPYVEFHLNYRVFGYGMLIALFFGVFSGAYPSWRMAKLHPVEALRGGV